MGMPDDEADGEAGREEEEGGEGEEEGCPSAGGGGGRGGGRGGGQQRGLFCHRRSRRERVLAVVYNYLCRARRSPMGNDGDRRRLQTTDNRPLVVTEVDYNFVVIRITTLQSLDLQPFVVEVDYNHSTP